MGYGGWPKAREAMMRDWYVKGDDQEHFYTYLDPVNHSFVR